MDAGIETAVLNATSAGCNLSAANLTGLCANVTAAAQNATLVHSVTRGDVLVIVAGSIGLVIVFSVLLGFCIRRVSADFRYSDLILDDSWKPSLAIFQFFVWTLIISFSYLFIELLRLKAGVTTFPESPPANLLLLMGISVVVPLASEKIAPVLLPAQRPAPRPPSIPAWETMFMQDGKLTLSRFQMFLWTCIAVLLYIFLLINTVLLQVKDVTALGLPDIDVTLVVLMGISQGAYLGNKLVMQSSAIQGGGTGVSPAGPAGALSSIAITTVQPDTLRPGQEISIFGSGFGNAKDSVWFNNDRLPVSAITNWTDTRIDLRLPDTPLSGSSWPGKYAVKVAAAGSLSAPVAIIVC